MRKSFGNIDPETPATVSKSFWRLETTDIMSPNTSLAVESGRKMLNIDLSKKR